MSIGLIHRRPIHPFAALREAERALGRTHRRPVRTAAMVRRFEPRLQAHETEAGWEVSAELPGVARADLDVSMQEGVLTIRGVRRFGRPEAAPDDQSTVEAAETDGNETGEAVAANEGRDANEVAFERQIRFNGDVDEDGISERYADGVLEVSVSRLVPEPPEVRTIPIRSV